MRLVLSASVLLLLQLLSWRCLQSDIPTARSERCTNPIDSSSCFTGVVVWAIFGDHGLACVVVAANDVAVLFRWSIINHQRVGDSMSEPMLSVYTPMIAVAQQVHRQVLRARHRWVLRAQHPGF